MFYIINEVAYIKVTEITVLVLITWFVMFVTVMVAIHRVLHNVKRIQRWIGLRK